MSVASETTIDVQVRDVESDVSHIEVVAGPSSGAKHDLERDPILVGSGSEVDVVLTDPSVSRLHCRLERRKGGVYEIEDLDSTNGTWIAGCRIMHALVQAGTRVVLGESAIELRAVRARVHRPVWHGSDRFGELVGASPEMHTVFAELARFLPLTSPVLVTGESGTGKELVARALHELGPRRGKPFVVLDGAMLASTLADAELFGHAKGAFTDAIADRAGAFERADGGTLFLDEVGEVPVEVQPKLLRAVERGEVQRVGGKQLKVDVRVIAATNRDVERMVNEGTLRADLYHRLNVVRVRLPPLRARRGDVKLLAREMLTGTDRADGRTVDALERALEGWAGYSWPGNVRELRTFVRRVVQLGDLGSANERAANDDHLHVDVDLPYHEAKERVFERFTRRYVELLLEESGGNIAAAARRAGLNRGHLSELVAKHRLKSKS